MPSSRLELVREIKRTARLIQQEPNYSFGQIRFLRLHRASLQKELENLIA